jgi:hypothetical protein
MGHKLSTEEHLRPYNKYRQAHTPEDYLNQRLDKSGECWIFTSGKDKDGYGQCHAAKTAKELGVTRAHQMAYRTWVGDIPDGYFVCHTCDNPSCCNPAHLFAGTPQDNMDDMMKKGRYKSGSKPRFDHSAAVALHGKHTCMEAADILGVSFSAVCQVWRNNGLYGRSF